MTQNNKLDFSHFQGEKIQPPVKGAPSINRILYWSEAKQTYLPPEKGKVYRAKRYELDSSGNRKRVEKLFETLDDARKWQQHSEVKLKEPAEPSKTEISATNSPLFKDVVESYRRNFMPGLGIATQDSYEKLLDKYFFPLMCFEMNKFTPTIIDEWLEWLLKCSVGIKRRKYFRHELNLFKGICSFYRDNKDIDFVSPVRKYHSTRAKKKLWDAPLERDISPKEFQLFLMELRKRKYGEILAAMAIVQYRHALRISEAQAICHEDFKLVSDYGYEGSTIAIRRHVITRKGKGRASVVETGTKNSKSNTGAKKHTTFPDSHTAFMSLYKPGQKGYMFSTDGKHYIDYRDIQYAYTQAFAKAGLPYTATHVLKYGGGQEVANEFEQAIEVAKQVTGNSKALACHYAVRPEKILNNIAKRAWQQHLAKVADEMSLTELGEIGGKHEE